MQCSVFFYCRVHTITIGDVMHSDAICCYYLEVLLELADFYVFSIKNDMPLDIPTKNCPV